MSISMATLGTKYDPLATGHLEKDLNRFSARGGLFTVGGQAGLFVIQTSTMIGLARFLSPYDFGLFGMVTAVTGFMLLFKDLGLSTATIQKKNITQAEVSLLFWINVTISTLLGLIVLSLAPVLSWFYHEPKLLPVVLVLSIGFFVSGVGAQHQAILNRQMRFRAIAVSDNLSVLLSSSVGLLCAWWGLAYWSLVAMQVTFFITNNTLVWLLSGWKPSAPAWHSNAWQMLTLGGHLTGGSILNYVSRNIDNFLIGRFWGPISLGYYGRAYQLLLMPTLQLTAPVRSVALPALSRLVDRPEEYRKMCRTILDNLARVSMPLIGYMVMCSDWLVIIVLGPKWQPSALIFACLGVATFLQPMSSSTIWIMISQGRSRDVFVAQTFASLMTLIAIGIGLPWGAVGVATAISVGELIIRTPYLFYMAGRTGALRSPDLYRACLCGMGPTLAVIATVGFFRLEFRAIHPWMGVLWTAPAAALVTVLAIYFLPGGTEIFNQANWFWKNAILRRTSIK